MKLILASTVALTLSVSAAQSVPSGLDDPSEPGPYAVGHSSFLLQDPGRTATIITPSGPVPGPRPIPVHVFYPADWGDVTFAPEAVYPLEMIYRATDPAFQTLSSEWEAEGIDGAYQDPPPSADGPFPVLMVSPGYGLSAWSLLYLGPRLASHGFVVVILYHYGDRAFSHEVVRDRVHVASVNRPLDLSFVLSALLARSATPGDPFWNLMDPERVAASGHSLGGYAAMSLAAGDDLVCDRGPSNPPPETCVPAWPDPRIRAIATLDGSTQLLWFDELARIEVPTLVIGREWSILAGTGLGPAWQARLHSASQGHPAYRVDVDGTRHITFANMCESAPILLAHGIITADRYIRLVADWCGAELSTTDTHQIVSQYMVAFLKTVLAGEPGHQSVLTPGYALNNEPWAEFFVTERRSPEAIEGEPDFFFYHPHQPGSEQAQAERNPAAWVPVPYFGGIGPG